MGQKINRELQEVIQALNIEDSNIEFNVFQAIMEKMHYIKESSQPNQLNKQDQLDKLLIEAYNFIKGDSENNPTLRHIKAFLFALNNICTLDKSCFQRVQASLTYIHRFFARNLAVVFKVAKKWR
jgi:DNA repair ATPase RecN